MPRNILGDIPFWNTSAEQEATRPLSRYMIEAAKFNDTSKSNEKRKYLTLKKWQNDGKAYALHNHCDWLIGQIFIVVNSLPDIERLQSTYWLPRAS